MVNSSGQFTAARSDSQHIKISAWLHMVEAQERHEKSPKKMTSTHARCGSSGPQVPKKHFNLDDDGMTWDLWISYLLTQGSWDLGVWQISTSRILHSGQNLRWTGFLNLTFTLKSLYMVTTNINKHNGISFLVQIFHKESDMYKIRCEIRCEIVI